MKYKIIDPITSDVGFIAYGKTKKELFENAAVALSSLVCDLPSIRPLTERVIEAEADTIDDLMINWLSAVIASIDIEQMFFSEFSVTELDDKHIKATCKGEGIRQELGRTLVKAVTYHNFYFRRGKKRYSARVSLDI